MKETDEPKNGTAQSNGDKSSSKKKIPIIDTLKPKKRYTKQEKEIMKVFKEAMEALSRQKNAKI